ncbi:MAG: HAD-IC family P-type ATPase [Gammaproteobacteria bacterium]
MSCASCEGLIQAVLKNINVNAVASAIQETVIIKAPYEKSAETIKKEISDLGFVVHESDASILHHPEPISSTGKPNYLKRSLINIAWATFVLTLSFFGLLPLASTTLGFWVGIGFSFISAFVLYVTSKDIYRHALKSALNPSAANMNTLLFLGTSASWLLGFLSVLFPTHFHGAFLHHVVDCAWILGGVNLGRWVREQAETRAHSLSKTIEQLYKELLPDEATLIVENEKKTIKRERIEVGQIIEIPIFSYIPVDGILYSETALINNEPRNGESKFKSVSRGHEVFAGGINHSSKPIRIRATTTGTNSKLDLLIQKLSKTQRTPSPFSPLIDVLAKKFVSIILITAVVTGLGWAALGPSMLQAFNVFLSIILAACPCALNVATPFSHKIADTQLAERDIFLKDASALEMLSPKYVVFDKTGTLTTPTVQSDSIFAPDPNWKPTKLLQFAASIERSNHPIAEAIRAAHQGNILESIKIDGLPYKTVGGTVDGHRIYVGHYHALVHAAQIEASSLFEEQITALQQTGCSAICIAISTDDSALEFKGIIPIKHQPRSDAAFTISELQKRGILVRVLTGDDAPVDDLARILNIPSSDIQINQTPEDKEQAILDLRQEGCVVYVGDGLNDTLASDAADVGIALNALDPMTSTASIILNGKLSRLIPLIDIAKNTILNIKQNLIWAFAFNLISLSCAALGIHHPIAAGLFMAFSSAAVVGNAARLYFQPVAKAANHLETQEHQANSHPAPTYTPHHNTFMMKLSNLFFPRQGVAKDLNRSPNLNI